MVSVNVKCSCGRGFVVDIPSGPFAALVVCPSCGFNHQLKSADISRDRFKSEPLGVIRLKDYYKVWASAVDGCSCSLCSKLEGSAVKLDEPFEIAGHIVQEPPLHGGCRCAVLFVDGSALEPRLIHVYNSFVKFSNVASTSADFQTFVSGFFAAEYFLGILASAPEADVIAAGFSGENFTVQLRDLQFRRDHLFNMAIKRAFDRECENAKLLKSERGCRAQLDRWLQVVVGSQSLAPVNYEYLKELFSSV